MNNRCNIWGNRVRFINTYVDNLTSAEAKEAVDKLIIDGRNSGHSHYVVTPNSDIVVQMQKNRKLKEACENADLILTDGMIVVKISRFLGYPIKERVAMTDFVWDVCDLADEKDYSVFFLGGKTDVLERAIKRIKSRYPKLSIPDFYSPPLGFEKDKEEIYRINQKIRDSHADILIVFLGCPKQERFIYKNKDRYQVPISITMGGCVDFIAGDKKRAPMWMQRVGLEWFYRFLQEPRRMYKRYFIDDIKIFGMAVEEKLRNC